MLVENAIQKTEVPAELRLAWDNHRARQDRFQFWFFVLFWIVWAPVTVFATCRNLPKNISYQWPSNATENMAHEGCYAEF